MDKITSVYSKLKELRGRGIKMKEIAERYDITPSVLSSLYSTILPLYLSEISKGKDSTNALEEALGQVNNLSRRKFFELLDQLDFSLEEMLLHQRREDKKSDLFFDDLKKESIKYVGNAHAYCGFYLGYSRSSHKDALKIEPLLILPPEEGEVMCRVVCKNELGEMYWGNGLFSNHQISYIFFNEKTRFQLGFKIVYMQLPMFDRPKYLKGVYLTHDFNRNPIARRVVYVRQETPMDIKAYEMLDVAVKNPSELSEDELHYYRYTCDPTDYIRSYMMSTPDGAFSEFEMEKKVLDL